MSFYNEDRAMQLIDFEGLEINRNTAGVDIDFIHERWGDYWLIVEVKSGGAVLKPGQKYLLENLTDALSEVSKKAMTLVVEHTEHYRNKVLLKKCEVRKKYENGRWVELEDMTVEDVFNLYLDHYRRGR